MSDTYESVESYVRRTYPAVAERVIAIHKRRMELRLNPLTSFQLRQLAERLAQS